MKVNVHDPRGEELAQVLTRATAALVQVPSPRVDAELLAAYLLYDGSRSRLQHAALMGERLTPEQVAEYEALVARRVRREPLQHITGSAPFYRLELAVGPGVFVPRPETELLVEEALKVLAPRTESATGQQRIVDLCTGSGAIAAAIKSELPNAQVFAVELSEDAIPYTRKNLGPARRAPGSGGRPHRPARARRNLRRGALEPSVHSAGERARRPGSRPARPGHGTVRRGRGRHADSLRDCRPRLRASYPRRPVHHGARRHPGRSRRRAVGACRLRGLLPGA